MIFKSKKGFTLIELLVVVAIIGILSSIVLVSLNSARSKGRDASAKGSMSSARASAELYFDTFNDYGGSVNVAINDTSTGTDLGSNPSSICQFSGVVDLGKAVFNQTSSPMNCAVTNTSGNIGYTLDALLNDDRIYCVDSEGYAGYVTAVAGPGVACLP